MDFEQQKLILSALAGNRELMALCNGIIQPSYFDPTLKKTVAFIKDYFIEYKDVPRVDIVKAKTGIQLDAVGEISKAEGNFLSSEIETFCQNQAMTEAVLKAPEFVKTRDFGKVLTLLKDAVSIGLVKDLGMDYFRDPEERLKNTLINQARISTGWAELDELTGGGLGRQELIMFAANSGGGKSMTMLNLGKNLLAQGLNGVYISLEMSEATVSKRLDSMITEIGQDSLLKEMATVAARITKASGKMGRFVIKRMPENRTNINTIRSYLQQLEQTLGFRPDFIIIDYIDIMGTTMQIDAGNLFVKDKYVTEEVRSLGLEFDCIMISASQLGRGAIDAEKLNQSHIQGGISKINTSDYTIGIKQDDLMRAAGEIYFEGLKTRNSAGTGVRKLLGWDPISLNIKSLQSTAAKLQLNKGSKKPTAVLNVGNTFFAQSPNPNDPTGLMQV